MSSKFPHYRQLDSTDCGVACLRMITHFYGKMFPASLLRERCHITRRGCSMLGICEAAESIGLKATAYRLTLDQLRKDISLPCILHWNQRHFVVCCGVRKNHRGYKFQIADPANQIVFYTEDEMRKCWLTKLPNGQEFGHALVLEPTSNFVGQDEEPPSRRDLAYFFSYLKPYKTHIINLILGVLVISILQLAFPFLTQSLVDVGINAGNESIVLLILISQLIISASQVFIEFIRSWILLHMNTRITISLISDFLIKIMKLPLAYFDTRKVGDIMQRIADHNRIENFLTSSSFSSLFSFFSFVLFGVILVIYNPLVFAVFLLGNALYVFWILAFMGFRRQLDIRRFSQASAEQSTLYQMVAAMQEIKLNNCERQKRWHWERIQARLFQISVKSLTIGQIQQSGSILFNQTTNIVISYIVARAVIDGNMTLGMMMSVTYIIGQLNAPVNALISFMQQFQDARISLERLNEVHDMEDEETEISSYVQTLSKDMSIYISGLSFCYEGSSDIKVLDAIDLVIPERKVTAVVGASGSGKTTLLKMLLGFYLPTNGTIKVGNLPLKRISPQMWRSKCGAVMQEGYIFSDTIARNIAIGDDYIDQDRLNLAMRAACINQFVDELPNGTETRIGMEGSGLSQGQKQRILIARAIYKNPDFLFLDEATNSLDADNEREILGNLNHFYSGRTVVVIAHRLSTVRNADNIVVMDKGRIVEMGTHQQLIDMKGNYYRLVKNQLEITS